MKIEDYLHLYIGCDIIRFNGNIKPITGKLYYVRPDFIAVKYKGTIAQVEWDSDFKPILRPLSDMTEEEMYECGNLIYDFSDTPHLNEWNWKYFETCLDPEQVRWLLSRHFDLFELIENGLAIDATKITMSK